MLHGSYRVTGGTLRLHFEDGDLSLDTLPAHAWHTLRRDVIGYVSQFLRVVPRVPAVEVVMEPLLVRGVDEAEARVRAEAMLARLNLPERLWSLPPGTFSPAVSSSGSILLAASSPSTRCCCWMSPPPRWMPPTVRWWCI